MSVEKKAHELAAACIDQITSDCIEIVTTTPASIFDLASDMRRKILERLETYKADGMKTAIIQASRL